MQKVLICAVALALIQTLPVFFPKPAGSRAMVDRNIHLYYQPSDERGATEVFELLKAKADEIRTKMGFAGGAPTDVFLYSSQKRLAIRKAGFVTLAFAPSWYIGDSHNGNIMMVSPYTRVKGHTHDSILNATLHELVHSIVWQINPKLSYFWDNGLATYLAQQKPEQGVLESMPLPTLGETHTENGLRFGNMGGYAFSYSYIEYLDRVYGWGKVAAYASGKGDYQAVFGKSEEGIYTDWCAQLRHLRAQGGAHQLVDLIRLVAAAAAPVSV